MLDELKNLEYHGGKEGLLYFLCDIIGRGEIKVRDAEVICSHAPGKKYLSVEELIRYCLALGWIHISGDVISVVPSIIHLIGDKEKLNKTLIISTIKQLFEKHIFNSNMFFYDAVQSCYAFKNELLPLPLSSVRNVLVSQGFLIQFRDSKITRFYIDPIYDALVSKYCKESHKQISLEKLKKSLKKMQLRVKRLNYLCYLMKKSGLDIRYVKKLSVYLK